MPTPNYIHSPGEVYFETMRQALDETGPLRRSDSDIATSAMPVPLDWTNIDHGLPKWIVSILQTGYGSRYRYDSVTLPHGFPTRYGNNHYLSLAYSGLIAPGRLVDIVNCVASPLMFPSSDDDSHLMNSQVPKFKALNWKTTLMLRTPFSSLSKFTRTAEPTLSSAVLNDLWNAIFCGDQSYAPPDEIRTSYALAHLCSNWTGTM